MNANQRPISIAAARTLLFVPGNRPDLFTKAAESGADGVVLDLEDSVPPEEKDQAREHVQRWLAQGQQALVRINGVTSPWFRDDVDARATSPRSIMLPKASTSEAVAEALSALPAGSCIVPIIETAAGVLDARSICGAPGVVRAVFGNGDLAAELGVDHTDRGALAHARAALVLASAAAGVAPPLDGVTTVLADDEDLIADTRHAAALGFTGKMCIHPRQIDVVHRVFAPSEEELRWARSVLAAAGDGGVAVVDGAMVDRPVVERARRLLSVVGGGSG